MKNLDAVESEIFSILQGIAKLSLASKSQGRRWPDGKWTKEIKASLVELGHNHGYEASASGCKNADCGEWLFDLAWYKYNSKRQMENLFLAMESEWGKENDIRVDFEKLLVVRSQYRLMIFQGNTIDIITNNLVNRINIFHGSQKGDRYLFAGWHWDTQKFIFSHHIV